jgi:hypothetical protein
MKESKLFLFKDGEKVFSLKHSLNPRYFHWLKKMRTYRSYASFVVFIFNYLIFGNIINELFYTFSLQLSIANVLLHNRFFFLMCYPVLNSFISSSYTFAAF